MICFASLAALFVVLVAGVCWLRWMDMQPLPNIELPRHEPKQPPKQHGPPSMQIVRYPIED
jgi:hypothetical protein